MGGDREFGVRDVEVSGLNYWKVVSQSAERQKTKVGGLWGVPLCVW